MKKIVCLGPEGTYSDIAAKLYNKDNLEIEYFPSIIKVLDNVKDDTIAIVPFENTLDGFVMETLDKIISNNLTIRDQLKLDIDFAFVANTDKLEDVKEVYAQFKAYGQCLNFIENNNFNVVKTESNIDSLKRILESGSEFGAIVPMHVLSDYDFPLVIKHIADSKNNETRFFVLDNKKELNRYNDDFDVSIVITSITDRPGILFEILTGFHKYNINLKSILSRPDKTGMGRYNFYIEFSILKAQSEAFYNSLENYSVDKNFKIIVLGVYKALK